jgi:hypothetical protein
MADREGRLEDRPARIKAEVLPYDSCDVESLLNSLAAGQDPFIVRYESEGRRYIQVSNFHKHQSPHLKEAKSTIPAPVKHRTGTGPESDQHQAGTGMEQEGHMASTVQAPDKQGERIPDILNPDIPIPDSLNSLSEDKPPNSTPSSSSSVEKPSEKKDSTTGFHFLAHVKDEKIREEITEIAGSIDVGRFNSYGWCQAKFGEGKFNAKAILYTLKRIVKEQDVKRNLWPYANKIYEVEYGNFNARDYVERSRQYKGEFSKSELVSIGTVLSRMAKPP